MSHHDESVSSKWPKLFLFTCLYLALGLIFISADRQWPIGEAIWPYTGFGVAGLLLFGFRIWPLILVLNLLLEIRLFWLSPAVFAPAVMESIAETVIVCGIAWVLKRLAFNISFPKLRDGIVLLLTAGLGALAGAGLKRAIILLVFPHSDSFYRGIANWLAWWRGDSLGILIFTPILLVWFSSSEWKETARRRIEGAALLASVALLSFLIFEVPSVTGGGHSPIVDLFFLTAFWAAMRFGVRGSVTLAGIAALVISTETFRRVGISTVGPSFLELWGLLVCLASSSLLMATALAERSQTNGEAQRLAGILEATPDFVGVARVSGEVLYLNRAARALLKDEEPGSLLTSDFKPAREAGRSVDEIIPTAIKNGIWSGESVFLHHQGEKEIPVSQVVIAHKSTSGDVEYLSTIARDISERKRIENALRSVASGIVSGPEFFQSLVKHLATALGVRHAMIASRKRAADLFLEAHAVYLDGEFGETFSYDFAATPSLDILAGKTRHYENPLTLFPKDPFLQQTQANAYMGVPLCTVSGESFGVLAVMDDKAIDNPRLATAILQIYASRAATEIERLRAEQSRKLLEEKFALAFFNSTECIGMNRLPAGEVVEVNDALLKFFGFTREEVVGRTTLDLGVFENPQERDQLQAEQADGVISNREVRVRRKSGEIRTISLTAGIVHADREDYVVYKFHDITEKSAASEELKRSEQKYRDLFENANDFIFTVDQIGNFRSANLRGEVIFGIVRAQLEKLNLVDLAIPDHRGLLRQTLMNVAGQKSSSTIEIHGQKRPEGIVTLELALRSVTHDGMTEIQGVARDITDRRMLEAQFRQVQKMEALGSLAGGVAHDFNNLLTVIKGYSVLAGDFADHSPKMREALSEIGHAADRGAGLTSQLLAFSRQQVSRQTVFSVDEALVGMEKMLMRVLGDDVSLTVNLGATRAAIRCDPTQFDQVLLNLAVNARDAMPSGGKLVFSSQKLVLADDGERDLPPKKGEYVLITAADDGIGMDAVTMGRIFEPFFTTKPAGKGTGLGLSTVYGIMQQNGGHIAVTSEVGKGTAFSLYFPVTEQKTARPASEIQSGNSRGSETIMLVDDDPALRHLSSRVLESMGYRVMCAAGMEEAQRLVYEFGGDIHLLVTDVVMPGGGGELLVEQLSRVRPTTGVLFMSGYTDGRIPQKYLTGQHPAFLSKPFTPAQLAEKVREMLDAPKA